MATLRWHETESNTHVIYVPVAEGFHPLVLAETSAVPIVKDVKDPASSHRSGGYIKYNHEEYKVDCYPPSVRFAIVQYDPLILLNDLNNSSRQKYH